MHKKVLLVEKSDSIRGVAESLLRQNGYEVIPLTDPEKALEVVKYTRPDLMITGSDLVCQNGKFLYERLKADDKLAMLPLLLFVDKDQDSLPFPEEIMITKPFDPKDFIERVAVFSGQGMVKETAVASNPLEAANLDDEFLDAALGLDQLDVVDSEVMNGTINTKRKNGKNHAEKMIGYDHYNDKKEDLTDTGKVESLMVGEDSTDIVRKTSSPKKPEDLSASAKLEILTDQYGISDPNALDTSSENQNHDYDWFINEMQREDSSSDVKPGSKVPPGKKDSGPAELKYTDPSATIDPVTPPPESSKTSGAQGVSGEKHPGSVEKFIDEFKKEMEVFQREEPDKVVIKEQSIPKTHDTNSAKMSWEDSIENVKPEDISLFTRQLAYDLAEKIALKIINKIDSEKLMILIRNEVIARAKKIPDKKSG